MYFPEKFYRIPLHFDHERLLAEISAVKESHWSPHPQKFKGNDALILLSSGGTINDLNYGPMEFTPCMKQLPYLQQVLESFNTVIGRTRLMRLAPGEKVSRHSDVSLYWWHRFRIHVPIVTDPRVKFYCEDTHVHMQAGESWTFDNWRYHEVHNDSDITRVHLVIDTVGSPALWNMLEQQSWNPKPGETRTPENFVSKKIPFEPGRSASFPIEKHNIIGLLSPAELDAIANFLLHDIDINSSADENIALTRIILTYIKREWRALWSQYGNQEHYYPLFASLLQKTVAQLNTVDPKPTLLSNGFLLANVLKTQVSLTMADVLRKLPENNHEPDTFDITALKDALNIQSKHGIILTGDTTTENITRSKLPRSLKAAPIFILALPCSGGLIVEKVLSQSRALKTLNSTQKNFLDSQFKAAKGQQIEDLLTTAHCSAALQESLYQIFNGQEDQDSYIYFDLKNTLRIDLLQHYFPNAHYIFVWRNPQDTLDLLVRDWQAGTYASRVNYKNKTLAWNHPLPAGWQELFESMVIEDAAQEGSGQDKLAEKIHFQYQGLAGALLQGISRIPPERSFNLFYEQLISEPAACIEHLCAFCGIPFGPKMREQVHNNELAAQPDVKKQTEILGKASPESLRKTRDLITQLKLLEPGF